MVHALNHPLRRQIICFAVSQAEPVSPASTSRAIDEKLSNVTYHVKELAKVGVLKLQFTRQVRGAIEHFYAPKSQALKHPMIKALLEEDRASN